MKPHSPEPWSIVYTGSGRCQIYCRGGRLHGSFEIEEATRMVACVNACQGWSNEQLEGSTFVPTGKTVKGMPVARLKRNAVAKSSVPAKKFDRRLSRFRPSLVRRRKASKESEASA